MSDISSNDVIWIDLCRSHDLSDKPFYTVSEANQLLERARSTIHRWIKLGHLDSQPWGPGGIVITRRSIRQLLGLNPLGICATGSTSTGSTSTDLDLDPLGICATGSTSTGSTSTGSTSTEIDPATSTGSTSTGSTSTGSTSTGSTSTEGGKGQ